MCPTGQVGFQSGHVLIFPAVFITFTELVQILAGHVNFFTGPADFQIHVPEGHVNQRKKTYPMLHLQLPNASPAAPSLLGGGWGCEVSCGGHHRPRGKTTTGSALDGAMFDIAQILAYLVHNMSRSQLYLGFGRFGWLPSFFLFRSITFWRAYG